MQFDTLCIENAKEDTACQPKETFTRKRLRVKYISWRGSTNRAAKLVCEMSYIFDEYFNVTLQNAADFATKIGFKSMEMVYVKPFLYVTI